MLVCAHDRGVDRQELGEIVVGVDAVAGAHHVEHPLVGAVETEPVVAFPDRLPWPEFLGQVAPGCSGAEAPGDSFQDQAVIGQGPAAQAFPGGHQWCDQLPQLIRDRISTNHWPIIAYDQAKNLETRPSAVTSNDHRVRRTLDLA